MSTTSVIHMPNKSPALPRGRLIFALDATASREPTWGIARELQAKMFREAAPIGKLDVQLVFYGGDKCQKTKWVSSGEQLAQSMGKIQCVGGYTQIGKVLQHVLAEHAKAPVQAVTFIGELARRRSICWPVWPANAARAEYRFSYFKKGATPKSGKCFVCWRCDQAECFSNSILIPHGRSNNFQSS